MSRNSNGQTFEPRTIDPQIGGLAAHGVIEEFTNAQKEVAKNQVLGILWQPIIAKYSPTLIGECQKAIKWAETMVADCLVTGMFKNEPEPAESAKKVLDELGSHSLTLSHARHISIDKALALGLKVTGLESDQKLQELVLTVHHACVQTLTETPALKIIGNHMGVAFIPSLQTLTFAR